MINHRHSGFSLIEIIIATAVLASVLVGLAGLLTYTSRSSTQAKNRVIAGELVQEGADFFRQERNILGWQGLSLVVTDGASYCLSDTSQFSVSVEDNIFTDLGDEASCTAYDIDVSSDVDFKRVARIIEMTADSITVEIEVFWLADGVNEAQVSTQLYLKPW
jgi:prepilin-type N-terminal cleavage/methylation domain-containing protein